VKGFELNWAEVAGGGVAAGGLYGAQPVPEEPGRVLYAVAVAGTCALLGCGRDPAVKRVR
jgi:hypothetical protein